jgi:hypothetical protein
MIGVKAVATNGTASDECGQLCVDEIRAIGELFLS